MLSYDSENIVLCTIFYIKYFGVSCNGGVAVMERHPKIKKIPIKICPKKCNQIIYPYSILMLPKGDS